MIVFDIETNGLEGDVIHCITAIDQNNERHTWTDNWREALPILEKADVLVGHNIIDFDIPFIQRLEPKFKPEGVIRDTLVMSRLVWPDVKSKDFEREDFPTRLIGSHSLKAWGMRLGNHKGDFEGPWDTLTDEMLRYAQQDVEVTLTLYEKLIEEGFSTESIKLEHRVHYICRNQEEYGFRFDTDKAWELLNGLVARREKLEETFQKVFPPYEVLTPFVPKANNSKHGYVKGKLTHKSHTITFNPNSRHHIANRLKHKYQWKPKHHTEKGQPKIDESILVGLPYKEAKLLAEYFLLQKRIAALGEGRRAWLNAAKGDRIHGRVICNGAVSGRATHVKPNMAQVPSVRVPYGKQCRELFTVGKGKVLVGSDISGLELRVLAHYMYPMDGGEYARAILEGDIHTYNQTKAGLDNRDQAKTFIYALIYSAGAEKLGQIAGGNRRVGASLKKKFLRELPALNKLIGGVTSKATQVGYLKGLDGRKLRVRSPHSSVNLLVQSAGAVICKRWLVEIQNEVESLGLDDRCRQVAWVHDEVQWECDKELGEKIGEIAVQSVRRAGRHYGIRMPLDAEYKIGTNWSETH